MSSVLKPAFRSYEVPNLRRKLAFFQGKLTPIALGYSYRLPALVGVGLAVAGAAFAYLLAQLSRRQPVEPAVSVVAGH